MAKKKILIYFVVLTIGVSVTVYSTSIVSPQLQKISESIGIGLLVTAFIGYLELYLAQPRIEKNPVLVSLNRQDIDSSIYEKIYKAKHITLTGISLNNMKHFDIMLASEYP